MIVIVTLTSHYVFILRPDEVHTGLNANPYPADHDYCRF